MKTNRKKYFLDRDEYDLMMEIQKRCCPLWAVTGNSPDYCTPDDKERCSNCVQDFLNEESEG